MTRITSGIIYHMIYSVMYLSPFILLMFICKILNLDLGQYLDHIGAFKQIIALPVLAYAFVLPGYRAKLAADAYGERDMGFWEAHSVSGVILKTNLSFLPIIGKLFN
jgi:hypothetical protein